MTPESILWVTGQVIPCQAALAHAATAVNHCGVCCSSSFIVSGPCTSLFAMH